MVFSSGLDKDWHCSSYVSDPHSEIHTRMQWVLIFTQIYDFFAPVFSKRQAFSLPMY